MSIATAANRLHGLLMAHYTTPRGIHAETIIAAAAALAGAQALIAMEPNLPPKGWISSEKALLLALGSDDADTNCLWATISKGALDAGVAPTALPDRMETDRRVAAGFGKTPYPPLTIPDEHYPREWSPNAVPRFRGEIARVAGEESVNAVELAIALALVTAALIGETATVLDPATGARLALEVMVGAVHMIPLAVEMN